MAEREHPHSGDRAQRINPFTVPEGEHGWRGLSAPPNMKRKYYTVLHNEQVLVTALLLMPGERSVRHSHETGELSISFTGELTPIITWHPPGELHGPPEIETSTLLQIPASFQALEASLSESNPEIGQLFDYMRELNAKLQEMEQRMAELRRPEPKPRVIVDVLFPPFKTTIDDPAIPEKRTIVGQWDD
ncbi:MAG TPA: hypothetical protein VK009_27435 [Chloroflexota bacterium]|nr:hypothetical protein [Chloroflexota bacterium]